MTSAKAAKLLACALNRMEIYCDPTDRQCGVDGIAREESRLYFETWVMPHMRIAIKVLRGEELNDEDNEWKDDRLETKKPHAAPYANPFSRIRQLDWATKFHRAVVEASSMLNDALDGKTEEGS